MQLGVHKIILTKQHFRDNIVLPANLLKISKGKIFLLAYSKNTYVNYRRYWLTITYTYTFKLVGHLACEEGLDSSGCNASGEQYLMLLPTMHLSSYV